MLEKLIKSWSGQGEAVHTLAELLAWIEEPNPAGKYCAKPFVGK